MTTEQYLAAQAVITAAAAAFALKFISLFLAPVLSLIEWLKVLEIVWPTVERFREQSAQAARTYYDSERATFHPELPRNDQYLVTQTFEEFVAHMEPIRLKVQARQSPKSVGAEFALQLVREVENAGRQQIIRAIENDELLEKKLILLDEPEPPADFDDFVVVLERKKVKQAQKIEKAISRERPLQDVNRPVQGWARVATGDETCAWCLMLVSRGPVYKSSRTAGSRFDNETTVAAYYNDAPVDEYMNEWHTGCDCKVIPVFDEANWPGMDAAQKALDLWNDAYDDAVEWREKYPGRVHTVGKNRGKEFTINEDQILALRRRIERGELNARDWAVLNQAA